MGLLTFSVPHSLSKEDARARIEALLQHWAQKHGILQSWSGDGATISGRVMGISLDGKIEVRGNEVAGESTDPGMLLRSQARKYVEERLRRFLDPAKSLAELKSTPG